MHINTKFTTLTMLRAHFTGMNTPPLLCSHYHHLLLPSLCVWQSGSFEPSKRSLSPQPLAPTLLLSVPMNLTPLGT